MLNIFLITQNNTANNIVDISLLSEINFQNINIIEFFWLLGVVFTFSLFVVGLFELIVKFLADLADIFS